MLVANVVLGSDGRWSRLFGAPVYHHARTAGHVYQASLRHGLTSLLALEFGPVAKGSAEVRGVDKRLIKEFSSRRQAILTRLDELGGEATRRTREIATLDTRPAKDPADLGDDATLRERWARQCREAGLEPPVIAAIARGPQEPVFTQRQFDEVRRQLFGRHGLTESVSAFQRRDVVQGVAERLGEGGRLELIEAVTDALVRDAEVVALDRTGGCGERLYTTRDMLAVEQRLLENAGRMKGKGAVVPTVVVEAVLADRPSISGEQAEMVRRLTTSGDGFQVVIGKAGAGKTYALDAARAAFQRAGFVVVGTALSARAAAELEAGAGIPSCTMHRFLDLDNLLQLNRKSVVVVDEAGMVGTRDLQFLTSMARDNHSTVILVGDPRQLPEIEAGGALGALARTVGPIELEENRRQEQFWERAALDELRHGKVGDAVVSYAENGRLHFADSAPDARLAMVSAWAESRAEQPDSRMYALARVDVRELNRLARAELRARGLLGDDLIEVGGRGFAPGDEVLFLRNERQMGVLNGTRGTVEGLEDGKLAVESDRGRKVVDPAYLEDGRLDHGYASTVHKAQGATVARAFVLGSEGIYREAGYVAMSRARQRTDLYVVSSAFDEGLAVGKDGIEQALAVSRAKELAVESLDPRRREGPGSSPELVVPPARLDSSDVRVDALERAAGVFDRVRDTRYDGAREAQPEVTAQLVGEAVRHLGADRADGERDPAPALKRSAWARSAGAVHERLRRRGTDRSEDRGKAAQDGSGGDDDPFEWIRIAQEMAAERDRGRGLGR